MPVCLVKNIFIFLYDDFGAAISKLNIDQSTRYTHQAEESLSERRMA